MVRIRCQVGIDPAARVAGLAVRLVFRGEDFRRTGWARLGKRAVLHHLGHLALLGGADDIRENSIPSRLGAGRGCARGEEVTGRGRGRHALIDVDAGRKSPARAISRDDVRLGDLAVWVLRTVAVRLRPFCVLGAVGEDIAAPHRVAWLISPLLVSGVAIVPLASAGIRPNWRAPRVLVHKEGPDFNVKLVDDAEHQGVGGADAHPTEFGARTFRLLGIVSPSFLVQLSASNRLGDEAAAVETSPLVKVDASGLRHVIFLVVGRREAPTSVRASDASTDDDDILVLGRVRLVLLQPAQGLGGLCSASVACSESHEDECGERGGEDCSRGVPLAARRLGSAQHVSEGFESSCQDSKCSKCSCQTARPTFTRRVICLRYPGKEMAD